MTDRLTASPMETRCSVALFRGDTVLLVHSTENGATVWKLPGGHVWADEGLIACAQRELREETGLVAHKLHCGLLIDTHDRAAGRYVAEIVLYPDEVITGTPQSRELGRVPQFVPLATLTSLPLRPPIASALADLQHLHLAMATGVSPRPVSLYGREADE